ncbi:hypothetical protein JTE90_022439 [Oedothorax gibbosus]|uniref:Uncharacterized protein n=1 Tax=Oedothorax gibbosus TaxID=931172 RepID=A0AAV6TSJ8_9ARAC|nr:hypothetical protein JTE90_022439 [Oedothorax gibbosus]
MEIQGKGDRNVPVLLAPAMKNAIEVALKWRDFVGVDPANDYLFARCSYGAKLHYRGSNCINKFSLESGVKCQKP